MKIIHITDVHLVPSGKQIFESNPEQRFRACLDHIAANHEALLHKCRSQLR